MEPTQKHAFLSFLELNPWTKIAKTPLGGVHKISHGEV